MFEPESFKKRRKSGIRVTIQKRKGFGYNERKGTAKGSDSEGALPD